MAPATPSDPSGASPQPPLDTRALTVTYVNYHRAAGTADELVLDFGM